MRRIARSAAATAFVAAAVVTGGCGEDEPSTAARVQDACVRTLRANAEVMSLVGPGARQELFERARASVIRFRQALADITPADGDDAVEFRRLVDRLEEAEAALDGLITAERSGDAVSSTKAQERVNALQHELIDADLLGTGDCFSGKRRS